MKSALDCLTLTQRFLASIQIFFLDGLPDQNPSRGMEILSMGLRIMKPTNFSFLSILVLLIAGNSALASSASTVAAANACRKTFSSDYEHAKCLKQVVEFETNSDLISLCGQRFSTNTMKMNCIRSGNSIDLAQYCAKETWGEDSALTCMNYLKSANTIRGCKKIMASEEAVLSCIRTGKEYAQILACGGFGSSDEDHSYCLKQEYPVSVVEKCDNSRSCLDNFIAERDQKFLAERQQIKRSLASEKK